MKYFVEYVELPKVEGGIGQSVSLSCDGWEKAQSLFKLAKKEKYDPKFGVVIKTEQGITKMSTNLLVSDCFNADGSFKEGYKPNKAPTTIKQQEIDDTLFDEDGDAKLPLKDIEAFLTFNPCKATSDIACYYYSMRIENVTKGNYHSIVMWR